MWERYNFIKNGNIAAKIWIHLMKDSLVLLRIKNNQDARIKKEQDRLRLIRKINCLKKKFRIYSCRLGTTEVKRIRRHSRNSLLFSVNSQIEFLEQQAKLLIRGFLMKTGLVNSVVTCVTYTIGVIKKVQISYRNHFVSYKNRLVALSSKIWNINVKLLEDYFKKKRGAAAGRPDVKTIKQKILLIKTDFKMMVCKMYFAR